MLCMYVALEQDLKHLLKNVHISFRENISFLLFFFSFWDCYRII